MACVWVWKCAWLSEEFVDSMFRVWVAKVSTVIEGVSTVHGRSWLWSWAFSLRSDFRVFGYLERELRLFEHFCLMCGCSVFGPKMFCLFVLAPLRLFKYCKHCTCMPMLKWHLRLLPLSCWSFFANPLLSQRQTPIWMWISLVQVTWNYPV